MALQRQSTEERKQQIAEAALRIISNKGVSHLTALELAKEVGIADGTIFRHFKDKAAIVRAAIEYLDTLLFEDFPPKNEEPLERLGAFFKARLKMVQKLPAIFLAAFSDRLEEAAGQEGASLVRSMVERSHAFVRSCVVAAQQEKLVDPSLPPDNLVWIITGTMQATAFSLRARKRGTTVDPDAVWKTLEALLCATGEE